MTRLKNSQANQANTAWDTYIDENITENISKAIQYYHLGETPIFAWDITASSFYFCCNYTPYFWILEVNIPRLDDRRYKGGFYK